MISSVFGGACVIHPTFSLRAKEASRELLKLGCDLKSPSYRWVFQQLLHPILFLFIIPLYEVLYIGKLLLVMCQRLGFLSFPLSEQELRGIMPEYIKMAYPNALAVLCIRQLRKLERFTQQRRVLGRRLSGNSRSSIAYLRYPIVVDNRDELVRLGRKNGIYFGTWYAHIIDPYQVSYTTVRYTLGSCPVAENIAKRILNVPTYPLMNTRKVQKIITFLDKYLVKTKY